MKKSLSLIAACTAAALLLAGCADSRAETDSTAAAEPTAAAAVETAADTAAETTAETAAETTATEGTAAEASAAEASAGSASPVVYFTSDRSRKITALRRSRTSI